MGCSWWGEIGVVVWVELVVCSCVFVCKSMYVPKFLLSCSLMLSSKCPKGDIGSGENCVVSKLPYQCWIKERIAGYFLVDIAYDMQLKINFFPLLFE